MPGEPFYPDPERCSGALRLNFSHTNEAEMGPGLGILAELIRETRPTPWDRKA